MKNILIVAVLAAIGLVGCGGGGGSGAAVTAAAPTVTITAANQASVARAIVDGGQAFGTSQPFAATGGGATEQSAAATRAALHTGALQSVVRRGLAAAFAAQRSATIAAAKRPTATTGTTDLCAVSGSVTTAVLDADGSQSLSNGDVLTITFNQCNDSDAVMSGVMSFTLSNVTSAVADNVRFSGTLAFTQVTATSSNGSSNINGSVGVAVAITSTSFQLAITVGGSALTVASSAPGYLDTVVYEQGMQLTVSETDGLVSQSTVTLDGSLTATSIGGRILIATVQPLQELDTDAYPSSGQMVVTGAAGTHLRVTALNATQVQLELDANGDGAYEGSGVFAWGSL